MLYWIGRFLMRRIFRFTLRIRKHGLERGNRDGGYILACSHISHLDPFCLSAVWPRKVGWMARIEFYRHPWAARMMRAVHAFPVNRQGVPVSAIRESLVRLEKGEVVGLFPEGEIKAGALSVLRGGPIKRGVCLLAMRSGRPILPCIILGTEKFNSIDPWLPCWRGRMWVFCGDFIEPPAGAKGKAARAELAARLEQEFQRLFSEMKKAFELPDSVVP